MSKIIIRHFGSVKQNGDLIFNNIDLWNSQRFNLAGKNFELVITEKRNKPNPGQFGFLMGGIMPTVMSCEEFSHYTDPKELFEDLFADMFLSYQVLIKHGKLSRAVTKTRQLSDLSKKELSELIEKILNWCMENDIKILSSEEYVNKYYRTIEIEE